MELKINALAPIFQKQNQLVEFVEDKILEIKIPKGNLMLNLIEDITMDDYGLSILDTSEKPYIILETKKSLAANQKNISPYYRVKYEDLIEFKLPDEDILISLETVKDIILRFEAESKIAYITFCLNGSTCVKYILTNRRVVSTKRHIHISYSENKEKTANLLLDRLINWFDLTVNNVNEMMPL